MNHRLAISMLSWSLAACSGAPFTVREEAADASREDASGEDAPIETSMEASVAEGGASQTPPDAPAGDSAALPVTTTPPATGQDAASPDAGETGAACPLPPGSYQQSCGVAHCSMDSQCSTLTCSCPNDGGTQQSSLPVSGCFDIAELNGVLTCECSLPAGSYQNTCRGCTVDPSCATLACSCPNLAGSWVPSTVSTVCAGQIQNVDGILTCIPSTCPIAVVQDTYDTTYDGLIAYTNTGVGDEVNPRVQFTLPAGATLYPDGCVWMDQIAPGCTGLACSQSGTTVTFAFTGSLAAGAELQLYYSTDQATEPPATNVVVLSSMCP